MIRDKYPLFTLASATRQMLIILWTAGVYFNQCWARFGTVWRGWAWQGMARQGKDNMTYEDYIASSKWKAKRERILKRDHYHCMLCHSDERLEVHHNSYQNLFNENDDDLVTLCRECHERVTNFQRSKRYSKRKLNPEAIPSKIFFRKEVRHGTAKSCLQDSRGSTIDPAQRQTRRSNVRLLEGNEGDIKQAR